MSDFAIYAILTLIPLALLQIWLSFRQLSSLSVWGAKLDPIGQQVERQEARLREEMRTMREELAAGSRQNREEGANSFKAFNDSVVKLMSELGNSQKLESQTLIEQLGKLTASIEQKLEAMRKTVEEKLQKLQEENTKKLDQMRQTVDEKLQSTLDKRLGESFKQVSERLELVHKGLGEMQSLANGVGDLKKVLTNVKVRGAWGEIQLGSLLEEILAPEQFEKNVRTRPGHAEVVEFAIKLPGKGEDETMPVWLPVDSKFPMEDYERLVLAQEAGDVDGARAAASALEGSIKTCARDIAGKYLEPPFTTDFAIMFLPVEGLYAEVLRIPGLVQGIQADFRVSVAGPTTFAALLNSLQMGFRTLAIEKRSSEVWSLLGAVKTQFGKFGEVLDRVKKNIEQAGRSIEGAATKTRTIERKLREVEVLPAHQAERLLGQVEESLDEDAEGPGAYGAAEKNA